MTENHKKISCIIPAYNEAKTIAQTLEAVSNALGSLDEIIVIDDGSTDTTVNIVKQFPQVRLLINEKNLGKSKSIARGIIESSGDLLLFLDADLIGLAPENITELLKPVVAGSADIVISIRGNSPWWMRKINLDFMSGERVMARSFLLPHAEQLAKLTSFGLEVFMNRKIIESKLRIKSVVLDNMLNDPKWTKHNFFTGVRNETRMWRDIFKTIPVHEFVTQNIKMRKLLV